MGQHKLAGNPPIEVNLKKSARARRISLRVSRLDGRVTLTMPRFTLESEALAFAREKEPWLRKQLDQQVLQSIIALDSDVPFEGHPYRIIAKPDRGVQITDQTIAVSGKPNQIGARLAAFFKATARDRLAEASDYYAGKLGRPYTRITMRDTRSRWGSCTTEGALMYSWRLIMAPPDVLRYVAAHEVAHLKHMDHSKRFWAQVEALYGDYRAPRAWLRKEGRYLHSYRFKV